MYLFFLFAFQLQDLYIFLINFLIKYPIKICYQQKNSRATVLVSLEETRYCENKKIDPEDPRCTRLMLSGKMKKVCIYVITFS